MEHTSLYIGRQIGNYRIEREIASGGFGTVFLARHVHLNQRQAVIKLLHTIRLNSEEERTQFMQEAQILDTLRGLPHILPMLDFGIEPGGHFPYMIAEYAERGSLRTFIKQQKGAFSLIVALQYLTQIGQGLQAAHDKQVVHRDLKPENILFNARDEALLADFGLSTVLTTTSMKHADVAGSPAYMAPEQFRGHISKESDQYALACIAYELLTGRRPFEAANFLAMGFLHTTELPKAPGFYNPQLPSSVDQIILKALAKERTARFPNIHTFLDALQKSTGNNVAMSYGTLPASPIAPPDPTPSMPGISPLVQNQPAEINTSDPYGITPSTIQQTPLIPPPPPTAHGMSGQSVPPQSYGGAGYAPHAVNTYYATSQSSAAGYSVYPPAYGTGHAMGSGGYMAPQFQGAYGNQMPYYQNDPFLEVSGGARLLAACCYFFSPFAIFFSIPLYLTGSKRRFARFHLMHATLFWVMTIGVFMLLYMWSGGSTPYDQATSSEQTWTCILGLWFLVSAMLVILLSIFSLLGRYLRLPLLGFLAEKYADRGRS